jgi:low temperature requirement protein LtrA
VKLPPDAAHLPERFGLFTLILLGESVVAVMQGMESQEEWTPAAAAAAFLGMSISFLIWWWYFDGAAGASEQPVRTKRDALRFHVWSYAHFPLYLGIVVTGVGVQRIVTAASRYGLSMQESLILIAAAALSMTAMAAVGATSSARSRAKSPQLLSHLLVALTLLATGIVWRIAAPLVMVVLVAVACGLQLTLALNMRRPPTIA